LYPRFRNSGRYWAVLKADFAKALSLLIQVVKRHGVSEPSIYAWRKKFGDMGADDVRRLKQLEQENSRLKKTVAERDLEIEVMKEIAAKKW
jgi:putative transposase